MEEQEPESFRASIQIFGRQADPFQRRQHIVRQDGHSQPSRIGSESAARHGSGSEFILQYVVDMFDRTGFLAMPLDQSLHFPFEHVCRHSKVLEATAVSEQLSLFFSQAERNVANGARISPFGGHPLHEIHFGTFANDIFTTAGTRLPISLSDFLYGSFQLRAHSRRYRKSNETLRP